MTTDWNKIVLKAPKKNGERSSFYVGACAVAGARTAIDLQINIGVDFYSWILCHWSFIFLFLKVI